VIGWWRKLLRTKSVDEGIRKRSSARVDFSWLIVKSINCCKDFVLNMSQMLGTCLESFAWNSNISFPFTSWRRWDWLNSFFLFHLIIWIDDLIRQFVVSSWRGKKIVSSCRN
jgi:hypothetical protein